MRSKLLFTLFVVAIGVVLVGSFVFTPPETSGNEMKKFSSYEEIENFLKENTQSYYNTYFGVQTQTLGIERAGEAAPTATKGAEDYSTTNIQVAGVDEADIVKNDDKYIYAVVGKKVVIIDAFPATDAKILSEIEFNATPNQIFINGDKLVVFGQTSYYYPLVEDVQVKETIAPTRSYGPTTFINVYDVSDRQNPVLERNVSVEGNYYSSRMIGDYVYAITNDPVSYVENGPVPLPVIYSGAEKMTIAPTSIYYFDYPDYSYIFTNVLAINVQDDGEELSSKTYLMGYTQSMYVSKENMYITYQKRVSYVDYYDKIIEKAILPFSPSEIQDKINDIRNSNMSKYEKFVEIGKIFQEHLSTLNPEDAASIMKNVENKMTEIQEEIAKEREKTVVHKISVDGGNVEYKTNGEVPGYVLNQFSMDEYNGYFRIATTTANWQTNSLNHVYVLDENLKITGKVEDLAKGERIYSARFIGDKAYMVTFRQIDPLFVIDLKDPYNPTVLGYLKIPGVSDYLHPYDETHVIGVGRDATEEGRITGMKLSLFDVSDVENPKEVSKYIIGDRGTYSEALYDHKAFLFSSSKNLLVIPVRLAEGDRWDVWQGAYVFNVNLNDGFTLKGKVTHRNENTNQTEFYYDYQYEIRRSMYMDDTLYTVSNKIIKMNDLNDMHEINKVELPYNDTYRVYGLV